MNCLLCDAIAYQLLSSGEVQEDLITSFVALMMDCTRLLSIYRDDKFEILVLIGNRRFQEGFKGGKAQGIEMVQLGQLPET